MSEPNVDDLLRDLKDALDVDPSPAFAAGVRTRLEADAARRRTWLWSTAALVAASVVIAVGFTMFGRGDIAAPVGSDVAAGLQSRGNERALSDVAAGRGSDVAAGLQSRGNSDVAAGLQSRGNGLQSRGSARPTRREPEVLVPPDQLILIEQLMAAIRDGRVKVEPGGPAIDDVTGELLPPPAIEIPPIVVRALPGTPERIDEGSAYR
jgi:hypothetical protein